MSNGAQPRTAEEIRADIERTREQLGATVQALAAKTDVKAQAQDRMQAARVAVAQNLGAARQAVTGTTERVLVRTREATPEPTGAGVQQVGSAITQRPVPLAVAGVLAAGLLIGWLMRRG